MEPACFNLSADCRFSWDAFAAVATALAAVATFAAVWVALNQHGELTNAEAQRAARRGMAFNAALWVELQSNGEALFKAIGAYFDELKARTSADDPAIGGASAHLARLHCEALRFAFESAELFDPGKAECIGSVLARTQRLIQLGNFGLNAQRTFVSLPSSWTPALMQEIAQTADSIMELMEMIRSEGKGVALTDLEKRWAEQRGRFIDDAKLDKEFLKLKK